MPRVESFAPIARRDATVLVLGSMPGEASLRARQYYAHPRNHFWPIVGEMFGFDPAMPYARRIRALRAARIAVWDVLQSCVREGSLDSAIDDGTLVPNDFAAFLARHPRIARICFNGAKAQRCFQVRVLPGLGAAGIDLVRLPSTSPANACIPYARKRAAWRVGLKTQMAISRDLRGARAAARS